MRIDSAGRGALCEGRRGFSGRDAASMVCIGASGSGDDFVTSPGAKQKNPVAIATAIREIEPVLKKAISKCDKKRHADTLTALTKYPNLLVKERESVIKLIETWATKGVVVNMDSGDKIIDDAVDDIYKIKRIAGRRGTSASRRSRTGRQAL